MKLLLLLTFLALFCLVRCAPAPSSPDGRLVLPSYDLENEIDLDDNADSDDEDTDVVTTTIPSTAATSRSTFVFPTRSRPTLPSRRPWLTQRTMPTTTIVDYETITDDVDTDSVENGFKYFRNIGEFFKKLLADLKKFFQNMANNDIIRFIRQLFTGRKDD